MRYVLLSLLLLLVVTGVLAVPAEEPQSEAAAHYLAGLAAWNDGQVDLAIQQWRTTLQLKPDSDQTKDKLIEALSRKIEILEAQLAKKAIDSTSQTKVTTVPAVGTGWRLVSKWNGSGMKSTEKFRVSSDEWLICWRADLDTALADTLEGAMIFQIFVDGSTPASMPFAANVIKPGTDSTCMHGAGDYYLTFNSFGACYAVAVYEKQ